jgi:hypothetical protein
MKQDFRQQPCGEAAQRFCSWLEQDTVAMLRRSYGDAEATKGAIFLFVNRAYESHMPEARIGELFGKCKTRNRYSLGWSILLNSLRVHGDGG